TLWTRILQGPRHIATTRRGPATKVQVGQRPYAEFQRGFFRICENAGHSVRSTQHIISSPFSFDQPINAVRNDKRAPADLDDVQLFGSYKLKQFRPSDSKILASCS